MFPGDPRKTEETHMEVGKEKKQWIVVQKPFIAASTFLIPFLKKIFVGV